MAFVLEYVKVLSPTVPRIASVAMIVDAHYKLRGGVHVTCLAPVSDMAPVQQKAQCVLWYVEFKSIVTIQRNFRRMYGTEAPTDKSITRWFTRFKETRSVEKQKSTGRPRTSEEIVKRIRQSCVRSPKKSIARRSLDLGVPKNTIQNVLQERLRLHAYKIQLRHEIKVTDRPKRVKFANFMLSEIDDNEGYNG
jgi:hypothetical protein